MDAVLVRLRSGLIGRYEVEEELGHGGMAVVYLARDLRHERRVALKVLRSDLGSSGSERFLREIRTVAQLHHPHVLGLIDSGNVDEHLFYVMPYVEGETLRERLEREGQLPVDDAMRITREVADALDYAHGRGIVHRDIKPENIFLSAGHALVADFGVARAADAAKQVDTTLTDAGLAVGTPAYMSPEQATANPRVDGRSDQYSLGCVLYEMLAGAPPFSGPTSQAVMARHTADPVPPLRTVRAVPLALENAIVKALAKVPADRWESTRVFAEALDHSDGQEAPRNQSLSRRTLGLSAAALAVVTAVLWLTLGNGATQSLADELPLVGVLAFDVEGDTTQLALADGIATQIANSLVRVVSVTSRGREDVYRNRSDLEEVGRELGVKRVLSGSVRVSGNKLQVIAQLTDVETGRVLWGNDFYAEMAVNGQPLDVFSIQDSISLQVVNALVPQMDAQRKSSVAGGVRTRDSLALRYYLDGRRLLTTGLAPLKVDSAISLFREAIERDSAYADAWVGWADALMYQPWLGYAKSGSESLVTSPVDYGIAVKRALEKALLLEPGNVYALKMRADFRMYYDWDWDGARSDFESAARLAPGDEEGPYVAGAANFWLSPDSAVVTQRKRVAAFPNRPALWVGLGNGYAMAEKRDSALWAAEEARRRGVVDAFSNWNLMNGYLTAGRRAAADSAAQRMEQLGADVPGALALVAHYYARAGNLVGARRMLDRVLTLSKLGYVPPSTIGIARLATGDREGALADLEQSARNHDFSLVQDLVFGYDAVRGTERFQAVARKVFKNYPVPRTPWP